MLYATTLNAIENASTHRFLKVQQVVPHTFNHLIETIPDVLKDLKGHKQVIKYVDLRVSAPVVCLTV